MKKYIITIILIAIGTGLFTYGLFSFSFYHYLSPHYYYPDESLAALTVGAVLIVIGILLKTRKN